MSAVVSLINDLRVAGIRLWAEEGKLRFQAPKGAMTPEFRTRIGDLKPELLGFLQETQNTNAELPAPVPVPRGDLLPLSFSQQRMWFLNQMEDNGAVYNMASALRLQGDIRADLLARCFCEIQKRHEALRTIFPARSGVPHAVIRDSQETGLNRQDLSAFPNPLEKALEMARAEAVLPFSLDRGPLFRVRLLTWGDRDGVLLVSMHHLVSDGWSIRVLIGELGQLYGQLLAGSEPSLPPLPIQYVDFAHWQQQVLSRDVFEKQRSYWKQQLAGCNELLTLPTDRPRPSVQTFDGDQLSVPVSREAFRKLQQIGRQAGASEYQTFLTLFGLLLSQYSGQDDLNLGAPVANRNHPFLEQLIGLFVNTLVYRLDYSAHDGNQPSFLDFLERVRKVVLEADARQDLPFEQVVDVLQLSRDLSHAPLFQVMFLMRKQDPIAENLSGLSVQPMDVHNGLTQFDMMFTQVDGIDGPAIDVTWNRHLFDRETMVRFCHHFNNLMEVVAAQPQGVAAELTLLEAAERKLLLHDWQPEVREAGAADSYMEQIRQQVSQNPDGPALVAVSRETGQVQRWTYGELWTAATDLALVLRQLGVGPDVLVGVCCERDARLIVAILAVVEAGGAYLPLDPNYPDERLTYTLEDAAVSLLLTQEKFRERFALNLVCLDDRGKASDRFSRAAELGGQVDASHLNHVIYTSGSTGRAKGVAIPRAAVSALISWARTDFPDEWFQGVLAATSVCFDLSVFEIFVTLCRGGFLVLADHALELRNHPARDQVRLINTVPSAITELLRLKAVPPGVQVVNLAGEALHRSLVDEIYAGTGVSGVFNLYGPSEDTTYSTYIRVPANDLRSPLIGRAIAGSRAYVLDQWGRLVPVGLSGELFLSGEGLARGYYGRGDLTAERFLPDPFGEKPGQRMYRTGDLVRWDHSGQLAFLGRADAQVKLRGFRIELGEIEAHLRRHPQIEDAVVQVRKQQLVAYIQTTAELDARSWLAGTLPAYMVPALFVVMDRFPQLPNGKVNRKAFPEPENSRVGSVRDYVAPRTPTEQVIADIFAEVLNVKEPGIYDDFFLMGGHSLLATRVIAAIGERLGKTPALRLMFEQPSIAGLASRLDETGISQATAPLVPQTIGDGPLPLSFSQERLWFLDRLEPGSNAYNIAAAVRLEGLLDVARLRSAIRLLSQRHAVLAMTFENMDGSGVQRWHRDLEPEFSLAGESDNPETLIAEHAARPFNLEKGPLLRFLLVEKAADQHVLGFSMHHIISDGWSMGILLRELGALYHGGADALAPLPVQYADFAVWQKAQLSGERLEKLERFWLQELSGAPDLLALPTSRPRPAHQTYRGAALNFALQPELLNALRDLGSRQGATLFMTLRAAFAVLLGRYSGQDDLCIGAPVANRTRTEVEGLIGFFANTLVFRLQLDDSQDFQTLLKQTRQRDLEIYSHQDLPFERVVDLLQRPRALSYSPVFQVMFAFQNTPLEALVLPELCLTPLEQQTLSAKFDLTMTLTEEGMGSLEYNTDLFDEAFISRMVNQYQRLLTCLPDQSRVPLSRLSLLEADELELLARWNQTQAPMPLTRGYHPCFEEQAAANPNLPALVAVSGDQVQRLSYGQLNAAANRLAHLLRRRGIGPDLLVGVCTVRDARLIVALLAIQKAGGAYVPLDPNYPVQRIGETLADARVALLITQPELQDRFGDLACDQLFLDPWGNTGDCQPTDDANPPAVSGAWLSHLIYTSGSTGVPKGVAIDRNAVAALVCWARSAFPDEWFSGVLAATSVCFDLSVFEIFVTLARGGRLILAENALALREHPARGEVVLVNTVPSAITELLRLDAVPESVRIVNLAGEALHRSLVNDIYRKTRVEKVINLYGPSEDTTYSTYAVIEAQSELAPEIGVPIHNTRAYVVDGHTALMPPGMPGELMLAGAGLARGYHGRGGLTADRFLPDPFSQVPGARMYRTGDLVRRREDGVLDFLGRKDTQVKLRGFRIELGEIEARLEAHELVANAVVLVRQDQLTAYLHLAKADASFEPRPWLAGILPAYMIPSGFVLLDEFPLLPNGKVNRKALLQIEPQLGPQTLAGQAPRNPIEVTLAKIFSEILKVEQPGIHDDFFLMGGHSLLATRVISAIETQFETAIPLRTLFERPTIAALAEYLAKGSQQAFIQAGIEPAPRGAMLPLSFSQERLWFIDRLQKGSRAYNMPIALDLHGELDPHRLRQAASALSRRHEILRTTFHEQQGQGFQQIHDRLEPHFRLVEGPLSQSEVQTHLADHAMYLFDLEKGPLISFLLLPLAENHYVLAFNMHHIITDGWSQGILVSELAALYADQPTLKDLPIQFADYAVWQRNTFTSARLESLKSFWQTYLKQAPLLSELPPDKPRQAIRGEHSATLRFELNAQTLEKLRWIAAEQSATAFMTLRAAFALLLHRFNGQDILLIGAPVANRDHVATRDLIGFFVNTLVFVSDTSGNPSFNAWLRESQQRDLAALANQDMPFEKLIDLLQVTRSQSFTPLFQIIFAMQNTPLEPVSLPGLELSPRALENGVGKFDLTLLLSEEGQGSIEYSTDLYHEATIARFIASYQRLLTAIAGDPEKPIHDYALLTQEDHHNLLVGWNDTHSAYPSGQTLNGLFQKWAAETPHAPAFVYELEGQPAEMTYGELNRSANHLAHNLIAQGVRPGDRVALFTRPCPEMLAAILAILKAGAAYLPLDPAYPVSRLDLMIEDAAVGVVLVGKDLPWPGTAGVQLLYLDSEEEPKALADPPDTSFADGPAYIIYTSGSTGRPKGTIIPHRAVIRLVCNTNYLNLSNASRFGRISNISFDAATLEIWGALLNGALMVDIPKEVALDASVFAAYLRKHRVGIMFMTVALFNQIVRDVPDAFAQMEALLVGGEAVDPNSVRIALQAGMQGQLLNGYGPTENTTFSVCGPISMPAPGAVSVPLGHPIANSTAYIVDARFNLALPGAPGELLVGGDGLALGYLNQPRLTAEKFVPNPFGSAEAASGAGSRLYRTGDLARRLSDGAIDYLGRIDFQLKLRGFRIELGEIEAALAEHEDVSAAVALVRRDPGNERLIAFIQPSAGVELSGSRQELVTWLATRLPEFMVPALIVALEKIPMTANGKADRKLLADLDLAAYEGRDRASAYVGPVTAFEKAIAGVFEELLKVTGPSIHDSFFDLGGHSLLAMRLVSALESRLGLALPLKTLFNHPTIAGIAAELEQGGGDVDGLLPPVRPRGEQPAVLSFAQQRLWFLDRMEPLGSAYHVPMAFRLRGPVVVAAFQKTFDEMARRHESLRCCFPAIDGQPTLRIHEPQPVTLPFIDLGHLPHQGKEELVAELFQKQINTPFNLEAGPLLHLALVKISAEEFVLMATLHHIISDGWSMGILARELCALYQAALEGKASPLADLPVQYGDYALWQRRLLAGPVLSRQKKFWQENLAGAPALLELPTDFPRPARQTYDGATLSFDLDPHTTAAFKQLAREHRATFFMAAQALFSLLLARYTGQGDICIGSPTAGRTRVEVEGLIGFFVNTLVLRLDLERATDFGDLLEQAVERARAAFANQDLPFDQVVEAAAVPRSLSYSPLFQVMLIVQNTPEGELVFPGLETTALEMADMDAKTDLALSLTEEGLEAQFAYNTNLFTASTVQRMSQHFRALMAQVVQAPKAAFLDLDLMTAAERCLLESHWHGPTLDYDPTLAYHLLFEAYSKSQGDCIALSWKSPRSSGVMTYGELNQRANRLARVLKRHGVGSGDRVGLLLHRDGGLVVAMLATQKLGVTYVPMDPDYPADRISFTLKDADLALLLVDGETPTLADGLSVLTISPLGEVPGSCDESPANLAAIDGSGVSHLIYTSGSTGTPKGVMISRQGVLALIEWSCSFYSQDDLDGVLAATSVCFDLSVFEILLTLCRGGRVVLVENALALTEEQPEAVIRLVNTVPSAIAALIHANSLPQTVTCVNLAGEPLHRGLANTIYATDHVKRLFNLYGPSEDTTYSTWELVPESPDEAVLIGRPLAQTSALVLDQQGKPVPTGIPGELYLAGDSLAFGYQKRPGQTAERFIPNAFATKAGDRLYQTGDLVRVLGDGRLAFLGRSDSQIKLRGFRIELGEIERNLERLELVSQVAVVLCDLPVGKHIVAYLSSESDLPHEELRGRIQTGLSRKLPEYMLPSALVILDQLPLLPNGKINRRALPPADLSLFGGDAPYQAPRTPLEESIAACWQDLLGQDQISIHSDFFAMGGHSLLAARVVARLREQLGVNLSLRQMFAHPTVAGLAHSLSQDRGLVAEMPIKAAPRDQRIPLSYDQERLWFLTLLEGQSDAFNMPVVLLLEGQLQPAALEKSLQYIEQRHQSLRSVIRQADGTPYLQIVEPVLSLNTLDLSALPPNLAESTAQHISQQHARTLFDLENGPLFSFVLLRLAANRHHLLVNMHHIITDGWSYTLLINEMARVYQALASGQAIDLPRLEIQYPDYALWQRTWLAGEALETQLAWWKQELKGTLPVLDFPTDRPRAAEATHHSQSCEVVLSPELSESLRELSRREGASLFMTLLSIYQLLLSRYTRADDMIVGFPTAGRNRPVLEGLIGFFINTLVLRTGFTPGMSFRQLLQTVRDKALGALEHQDVPFPKLVETIQPDRDLSRNPIFQVFFNMINLPEPDLDLGDLKISSLAAPSLGAKFDMTLYAHDGDEGLQLNLHYNADLFDQIRMKHFMDQFQVLLHAVTQDPSRPIESYSLVTQETRPILGDPNSPLDGTWHGPVHALFTQQVRKNPEAPAIIDCDGTLTYGELDRLSNALANMLLEAGLEKGERVALYAHRRATLPLALMAIQKAGGAFVVLDPAYPAERLNDFLEVSLPSAWIAQAEAGEAPPETLDYLAQLKVKIEITLPAGMAATRLMLERGNLSEPKVPLVPEDVAYIAFTSGSTGKPKGIMGRQGPLTHFLPWLAKEFNFGPQDRFSALSGLSHDPLQRDIFTPLNVGAAVCIPDNNDISPGRLADWMNEVGVTVIHLTPAMGRILTEVKDRQLMGLRQVFYVGEALTRKDIHSLRKVAPRAGACNFYGATETQRAVGYYKAIPEDFEPGNGSQVLPLGVGMPGAQLLVLNANGEIAGLGEIGEVCVRSLHLAGGYMGDPVQTAARFLTNPFGASQPNDRIYKTGDLGYMRPDGLVIFAGRADFQLKIRGYRIEPAEIEGALVAHPAIREAVVMAVGTGTLLAAWIVPEKDVDRENLNPGALRTFLARKLPEFMIPGAYVLMETLPMTPNRKLDRAALPDPDMRQLGGLAAFTGPRTPTEEVIASCWQELLGVEKVSVTADFFSLGGHSLLAARVVSRIRELLGVDISLRALFTHNTVESLATFVDSLEVGLDASRSAIVPVDRNGILPLSHSQERLWFMDRLLGAGSSFNMPVALELKGPLNRWVLEQSLVELIARHESMRLTFSDQDGKPFVRILPPHFELELIDLEGLAPEQSSTVAEALIEAHGRMIFSLERGPLFAVTLVRLAPERHHLLVNMHHIVTDGWSYSVFVREMIEIYRAHLAGEPHRLTPMAVQYVDYAAWQRRWLAGAPLKRQLAWWKSQLNGTLPVLDLPGDRPRSADMSFEGAYLPLQLSGEISMAVRDLARERGVSVFMLLLSIFQLLLARLTHSDDIIVGFPTAGRNRPVLEGMIGFFINTLVVRSSLSGEITFAELLNQVRDRVLGALENQDVPFPRLVEEIQPERDLSRNPIFQVFFNMLNLPEEKTEVEGLQIAALKAPEVGTKFDLTLYARDAGEVIGLNLHYNVALFDPPRMADFLAAYSTLISAILARPEARLDSYALAQPGSNPILPDPTLVLPLEWHGTFYELFLARAQQTPQAPAIFEGDHCLSYAELNQLSGRLASRLLQWGLQKGDPVAVYAWRGMALPLALLSIARAGGAFVILDPAYPGNRLAAFFRLAGARALIALEEAGALPGELTELLEGVPQISLPGTPAALASALVDEPENGTGLVFEADDLACISFTSGSTGTPKAIMGRHGALTHFLPWTADRFDLKPGDRFSMLSGLSHDPLQRDIFTALNRGASLCIPQRDDISPGRLAAWMRQKQVTVANLTPAMGRILSEDADQRIPQLRRVFFVGEALTRNDLRRLVQVAPEVLICNLYGATETQRALSYYVASAGEMGSAAGHQVLPLGQGAPGCQLLIITRSGALAGPGEIGEICIRSRHLAAGYLGDETLTGERFIANPFGSAFPGDRVYKTGDLGYLRYDGQVIFAGRLDFQLKIRGFRIEPAEIEKVLTSHPAIAEAVVLGRGPQKNLLTAYLVPDRVRAEAIPELVELRRYLAEQLPEFMIPAAFVQLPGIPRTPAGKLDRAALPEPDLGMAAAGTAFVAPRNATEQALARIWTELLGVEEVGLNHNFFVLGGHSLIATQLISRVKRELGADLPLRMVFETPTLGEMAARLKPGSGVHASAISIPVVERQDDSQAFPLSFSQQRLWFLDRLEGSNAAYNISIGQVIEGPLRAPIMEQALSLLTQRHESLRTGFSIQQGEGVQIVYPHEPFELQLIDLSALANRDQLLQELAENEADRPFDLNSRSLFRCLLLRLEPSRHALLLSVHHIVSDGWSVGILARDIMSFYQALATGQEPDLPALPVQYADFTQWQRSWLTGAVLDEKLAYWKQKLSGAPELLALPTDRPRPPIQSFRGTRERCALSQTLHSQLKDLARRENASLYMVLLALFQSLLTRYSGQDDVTIGTPVANRNLTELENLNGFFVNTLALRTRSEGLTSFRQLLDRVRETTLEAFTQQDAPFEKVVDHLQPQRNLSFSPLFQVMMVLQNTPERRVESGELTFTPIRRKTRIARFDLLLEFVEAEDGLMASLEYNTDLFDRSTVIRLWDHLTRLAGGIAADANVDPRRISLMDEAEQRQILQTWNQTARDYASNCLHLRIEQQVAATPEVPALIYEDQQLSYHEFNKRANRLAHHLRSLGVGPEVPVGVYMERSVEMVVALLAVLKSGGYYVPLDPTYPADRIQLAIEDAAMPLILCQQQWKNHIPPSEADLLALDDADTLIGGPDHNPDWPWDHGHSAYAIYTSGSTGKPKGAINSHRGIYNRIAWMQQEYILTGADVVLQKTPFSFDVSVWEFFWAHMYGANLVVARPEGHKDPDYLVNLIRDRRITTLHFVPSMLQAFLEHPQVGSCATLRQVFCSGEALSGSIVKRLYQVHETVIVHNLYGPTEAAIDVSYYPCPRDGLGSGTVSIGIPVANTQLYILDPFGAPTPIGVPAELHIGGVQLATGYLNRPGLTADRFVPDPFGQGTRLYRTGDLARYAPNGNIQFLGRIDHQVKIRGVRIELGEIEAALDGDPRVLQSAVLVHNDPVRGQQLIGFVAAADASPYASAEGAERLNSELRQGLERVLPPAYIPAFIVVLPMMPLLPNGKIDRKQLVVPQELASQNRGPYVQPGNSTERAIAGVWAEVLQMEKVSINDSFFEIGGHSLLMIKVHLKLMEKLKTDMALVELFQYPTIRKLADYLREKEGIGVRPSRETGPDRAARRTDRQTTERRASAADIRSAARQERRKPNR